MSDLKETIKNCVSSCSSLPRYDDVLKDIRSILDELAASGEITLGNDKDLVGDSLEVRVKLILGEMGFDVAKGRPGLEDFVVKPAPDMKPNEPLVLEVKSSRKPNVDRDTLRQLDDWVFDLSGEEEARKHGLGGGHDPLAMVTDGMISSRTKHPSQHKGVLIFNGPVGLTFEDRPTSCINDNDIDFVQKRNFCIIPIHILLSYLSEYQRRPEIRDLLWERIHKTVGHLQSLKET